MKYPLKIALLGAGMALAVGLSGCAPAAPAADDSLTLTIGSTDEPQSWNPQASQEAFWTPFYQAVYDTLIKAEPDGTPAPMLAESWEYSEDLLTLTLKIRSGVTFSDGEVLDAEAVKVNLDEYKSSAASPASKLAEVESVDVVDDTTVALHLSVPSPQLLTSLSQAPGLIAAPSALLDGSIDSSPVGTGPYSLDTGNTTVGSQYTFVRNDDYWGEALPYDTLKFLFLPDETARLNALKTGQIDAGVFVSTSSAVEAESAGFTNIAAYTTWSGMLLLDRDGAVAPALADVRVRQALNYALDRKAMLTALLLDRGETTDQIFAPEDPAYVAALDDYYDYDPEKAKELLAEAGYADGFEIRIPTSASWDPTIFATIAQQWGDIGIDVVLEDQANGTFGPNVFGGIYPVTYMDMTLLPTWSAIQDAVGPTATWNVFKSETPEVTKLVDAIRVATDDAEVAQLGQELNTYLVENAWYAPFYRASTAFMTSDDVIAVPQASQLVPSIYNYSPAS